jgi:galactose mutarotase-like enzyme
MFTIENELIKAGIQAKGAELAGLYNKSTGLEYIWGADPAFWAKHSPVLFPIVGTLKNNTYFHQGKSYSLSRHGFARDQQFVVEDQQDDSITFLLNDDAASREVFPFSFQFRMKYTVYENSLAVAYEVKNTGEEDMYFSLGAHPAFKVPLVNGLEYTDYYLAFDKTETSPRWPISSEGLIREDAQPFLNKASKLSLSKALFQQDALVFKNLASSTISLKSDRSPHGLDLFFPGFPFMGIWAAKNADFVCIEPWCGIADSVSTSQQLTEKEGINRLQPGEAFNRTWTVTVF